MLKQKDFLRFAIGFWRTSASKVLLSKPFVPKRIRLPIEDVWSRSKLRDTLCFKDPFVDWKKTGMYIVRVFFNTPSHWFFGHEITVKSETCSLFTSIISSSFSRLSEPGVGVGQLTDQLTLSQPGRTNYFQPKFLIAPPPSNFQTFLRPCIYLLLTHTGVYGFLKRKVIHIYVR